MSDDRQPGGSGAGSTVSSGRLKAHTEDTLTATEAQALEAIIARPYMEECAQLRAALEAVQREIAKAQDAYERMADDRDGWRRQYAQSRATEAELRAKVEQLEAERDAMRKVCDLAPDALVILAGLHLGTTWELSPYVKDELARVTPLVRDALARLDTTRKAAEEGK